MTKKLKCKYCKRIVRKNIDFYRSKLRHVWHANIINNHYMNPNTKDVKLSNQKHNNECETKYNNLFDYWVSIKNNYFKDFK